MGTLSPTSSVVGGILAQDVVKVMTSLFLFWKLEEHQLLVFELASQTNPYFERKLSSNFKVWQ